MAARKLPKRQRSKQSDRDGPTKRPRHDGENELEEVTTQCVGQSKNGTRCRSKKKSRGGAPILCTTHQKDANQQHFLSAAQSRWNADHGDASADQEVEENIPPVFSDEDETFAPWILPQTRSLAQSDEVVRQYFQTLFPNEQQSKVSDERLRPSLLYSPGASSLARLRSGKDRVSVTHASHRSSDLLRRLWDRVHNGLTPLDKEQDPDSQEERLFENGFPLDEDSDSSTALVVTEQGDGIQTRNVQRDVRLTLRQEVHEGGPLHVDIIRRQGTSQSQGENPVGFFVHVPPNTTVTVNGQTFTNEQPLSSIQYMYIGPLEEFTIIELYGIPVFFWRRSANIDYVPIARLPGFTEEQARQRGDHDVPGAARGFIGIADTASSIQHDGSENRSIFIPASPIQSNRQSPHISPSQSKSRSASVGQKKRPIEARTASSISADGLEDLITYPCEYLRSKLDSQVDIIQATLSTPETRTELLSDIRPLADVIPLSVNSLTEENSLFGIRDKDEHTVLHRRRPYFAVEKFGEHCVLLVLQSTRVFQDSVTNNTVKVSENTVHVLDHLSRYSGMEDRYDMVKRASSTVQDWNRSHGIAKSIEKINFSHVAQAQDEQLSRIYTILSVWALSLGLDLNPDFNPNSETFRNEASDIILLARYRTLHWRLLYAFLRCHDFVRDSGNLPYLNRRFNLSTLPIDIIEQQRILHSRESDESLSEIFPIWISLPDGPPFDFPQRFDHQSREFRRIILNTLANDGQLDLDLDDEELRERYLDRSHTLESLSAEPTFIPPYLTSPIQAELPSDYDFDKEIGHVRTQEGFNSWATQGLSDPFGLTHEEIYNSIAAVAQAINEHQTPERGFALIDYPTLSFFLSLDRPSSGPSEAIQAGRPLVIPWTYNMHTVLVVIQTWSALSATESSDQVLSIRIDALDPGANDDDKLEDEDRAAIQGAVQSLITATSWNVLDVDDTQLAINWIESVQHSEAEDWQGGYITILNAWAILFGLHLNLNFEPVGDFWFHAAEMVRIVLGGFADHKLVMAFLRRYGFVTPDSGLRDIHQFPRTIPAKNVYAHFGMLWDRYHGAGTTSSLVVDLINNYEFRAGAQIQHEDNESETSGQESLIQKPQQDDTQDQDTIDQVEASAESSSDLSSPPSSPSYADSIEYQSEPELLETAKEKLAPEHSDSPCDYYQTRLTELKSRREVVAWLRLLSRRDSVSKDDNLKMNDDEVFHGIQAITARITMLQESIDQAHGLQNGFSMISYKDFKNCLESEDECTAPSLIRSGRPLLLPWTAEYRFSQDQPVQYHTILIIIQLDDKGYANISFLDSMGYVLYKSRREQALIAGLKIIRCSSWAKGIGNGKKAKDEDHKWIFGAQQRNNWSCGYYVILNAWALAMGLNLNLSFSPRSDTFFKHAKDITRIIRRGFGDWELVYNFLLCHEYIHGDQTVPPERRFKQDRTLRLNDHNDFLRYVRATATREAEYWKANEFTKGDWSTIKMPQGRPHRENFETDSWKPITKHDYVPDLEKDGDLDLNKTNFEIRTQWRDRYDLIKEKEAIQKAVFDFEGNVEIGYREALHRFQTYLESLRLEDTNACDYFDRRKRLMAAFRFCIRNANINFRHVHRLSRINELFSDEDIMLAIASVVQAIDDRQSHQRKSEGEDEVTFTGGFAMATPYLIALAQGNDYDFEDTNFTARSRRCWLLPVVVSEEFLAEVKEYGKIVEDKEEDQRISHTFLAIIQEELVQVSDDGKRQSEFAIYFADSMRGHFQDERDFLCRRIQRLAYNLQWSSYRNENKAIKFRNHYNNVKVPQQIGSTPCGQHTILNAWILALGLHPRMAAFTDFVYEELFELIEFAIMGLLEWKTLVSWFFCRGLVREGSFDDVPENRRFGHTRIQTNVGDLQEYIVDVRVEDQVAQLSELPLDFTNNVDFSGTEMGQELLYPSSPLALERGLEYDEDDIRDFVRHVTPRRGLPPDVFGRNHLDTAFWQRVMSFSRVRFRGPLHKTSSLERLELCGIRSSPICG